jgi:hypothetical protein
MATSTKQKPSTPETNRPTQSAAEKMLFDQCVAIVQALDFGSRERIANQWVGVITTIKRALDVGDGLEMALTTKHTERRGLVGCLMHEWEETSNALAVTFEKSIVFRCSDNDSSKSPHYPWNLRYVLDYVPGEWEKDIEALLLLAGGGKARPSKEIEERKEEFERIKATLKGREPEAKLFYQAMRKSKA